MNELNSNITKYSIESLSDLFMLNSNLIFRNKNVPLKITDVAKTPQVLFQLQEPEEEQQLLIMLPVLVPKEYILNVSNRKDQLKDKDIAVFFHCYGELLGRLVFFLNFDRIAEISKIDNDVVETKSSLVVLTRSFEDYARALDNLLQAGSGTSEEDDSYKNEYVNFVMKVNDEFISILDAIDIYSKESSNYVQPSTLLALNYIALTYSLLGSLLLTINPNSMSILDFIKRCSSSSVDQTLQALSVSGEDFNKIMALAYFWKIMNQYYMHGADFSHTFAENIIHTCLMNIGNYAYNLAFDDSTDASSREQLLNIIRNNCIKNTVPVEGFCDISHLMTLNLSTSDLDDENSNHIYYFKTLDNFIKTAKTRKSNFGSIISNGRYVASLNKTNTGFNAPLSLKKAKSFIEYIIMNECKTVSPKVIFKLLTIAAVARNYCYHSLRIKSINQPIQEPEFCADVIVMAETAVYNCYQEWFNRTDKIYRFEKRNFTYNPQYKEVIQYSLKHEIILTLMDYVQFCFNMASTDNEKSTKFLTVLPDLNELTAALHIDFRNAFPTISTVDEIYSDISTMLQTHMEYPALTDYAINPDFGKLGIIPILLYEKEKDTVLELLESNISLTDFFAQLETNSETPNDMKTLIEKLKPYEEIVGTVSKSEVYKRINTNINKIVSSGLLWSYIFYLTYGLNYVYIKHNDAQSFAENADPDIIPMQPRSEIALSDQNKLLSIENTIRNVFKEIDFSNQSEYKKYGFRS